MKRVLCSKLKCVLSSTFLVVLFSWWHCVTLCYSQTIRSRDLLDSTLNKECKSDINCAGILESSNGHYYCNKSNRRCTLCKEREWDSVKQVCLNAPSSESQKDLIPVLISVLIKLVIIGLLVLPCYYCSCCPGYKYARKRKEALRIQQQRNNAINVVERGGVPTISYVSTTLGQGGVTANDVVGYGNGTGIHTYTAPPLYNFQKISDRQYINRTF